MASAWYLGDTVTESFGLTTGAGQTFTRVSSQIDNVSTTWNPTFVDLGGGSYSYSYTPSATGTYEWVGTGTAGDFVNINFTVLAAATLSVAGSTVTRRVLRQRIADRFEDLVMLTATGGGSTTTFVDALNVNTGTEHYNGRVLYFTNGDNEDLQSRVTSTSGSTLTFTPSRTSTATNDTAEAYNRRGLGFTPDQYHRAINNAITDANVIGTIAVLATVSGTFDADTPEVTVPASVLRVKTVEAQDENGDWSVVAPARQRGGDGWYPDPSQGQIRIHGNAARQADGKVIRIHGSGLHSQLASDSDTAATQWSEYLVARAAYHLAFGAIHKHDAFGQMVTIFQQESERLRTRVRTLRDPNEKGVRSV